MSPVGGALDAYEKLVALGGAPDAAPRVRAMRAAFEARTGAFKPEDLWFEARSRAFWDDAVTTQRFARGVEHALPEAARGWLAPLERAHRGIFKKAGAEGQCVILADVWSGAEFLVAHADEGTREALDAAGGLFDARLVGRDAAVTMLPGALYHPEDATDAILAVLEAARAQNLTTDEVLDALMRMERSLRSLSRVKTSYAYRAEVLAAKSH